MWPELFFIFHNVFVPNLRALVDKVAYKKDKTRRAAAAGALLNLDAVLHVLLLVTCKYIRF